MALSSSLYIQRWYSTWSNLLYSQDSRFARKGRAGHQYNTGKPKITTNASNLLTSIQIFPSISPVLPMVRYAHPSIYLPSIFHPSVIHLCKEKERERERKSKRDFGHITVWKTGEEIYTAAKKIHRKICNSAINIQLNRYFFCGNQQYFIPKIYALFLYTHTYITAVDSLYLNSCFCLQSIHFYIGYR